MQQIFFASTLLPKEGLQDNIDFSREIIKEDPDDEPAKILSKILLDDAHEALDNLEQERARLAEKQSRRERFLGICHLVPATAKPYSEA